MRLRRSKTAVTALLGAFVVLSVVTLGCGGDKGTGPATGTISGTVYRAGSADPVYGAIVMCAGAADTTDGRGAYKLEEVPVGMQTLSASKANYEVFTTTVKVTKDTQKNIFISIKGGDGGDIGE